MLWTSLFTQATFNAVGCFSFPCSMDIFVVVFGIPVFKLLSVIHTSKYFRNWNVLLFLYLVVAPFNVKIFPNNKLLYVIGVWILVAMFIQKEGWLSKWLNEYSWTDISKYCLATYLLQGIVLRIFTKKVCNSYPEDLSLVWLVVLVVLCCWGGGVFGHYAVEVRGKRFMDYFGTKKEKSLTIQLMTR